MTVSDQKVDGKRVVQSIVKIFPDKRSPNILHGNILVPFVKIVDGKKRIPDIVCGMCKGELRDKPMVNFPIIQNLQKSSSSSSAGSIIYKHGSVIDPSNGKSYRLRIWTENNGKELRVRGYVMFLYRTQTWYKLDETLAFKYLKKCGLADDDTRFMYTNLKGVVNNKKLWEYCSNISNLEI